MNENGLILFLVCLLIKNSFWLHQMLCCHGKTSKQLSIHWVPLKLRMSCCYGNKTYNNDVNCHKFLYLAFHCETNYLTKSDEFQAFDPWDQTLTFALLSITLDWDSGYGKIIFQLNPCETRNTLVRFGMIYANLKFDLLYNL